MTAWGDSAPHHHGEVFAVAEELGPVYEETQGLDGHVSIEVRPSLAYDTEGTIEEAKRIFDELTQRNPNIMIKAPATPQGLAAVKDIYRLGINLTLSGPHLSLL